MEFKIVENEIIPIYENHLKKKYINARELHQLLKNKRKFTDWIKQRIEQYDFVENSEYISFSQICEKPHGGRPSSEYYITIDMAKELCMVENNEIGKKLRRYFIETEKRYRQIIQNPNSIFDFMRLALDQIEFNENKIEKVEAITRKNTMEIQNLKQFAENKINGIKSKIDVIIKKEYCLASDIAEQLELYSENNLPHSNLVAAIARQLGYKNTYKHYYEDENIAIVPDISKGNSFWQVYYKEKAVAKILKWFYQNKLNLEYKIIYQKNTSNGKKR